MLTQQELRVAAHHLEAAAYHLLKAGHYLGEAEGVEAMLAERVGKLRELCATTLGVARDLREVARSRDG